MSGALHTRQGRAHRLPAREPTRFLTRPDATLALASAELPTSPSSVSSSGTRAAEQLVGGIGAVIRSVFPRTDNPIPQGSVSRCFSSLSPEIHLRPPTGARGPQLRRQVDVGDLRSPVLNKICCVQRPGPRLGESSTILEPIRPCSGTCAWPREARAGGEADGV